MQVEILGDTRLYSCAKRMLTSLKWPYLYVSGGAEVVLHEPISANPDVLVEMQSIFLRGGDG